ncbi:MAG: hypothetical protein JKX78_04400 [Alteromonadaceae bacterium]|nr:hypothetical protein [Alteromonadaceae bacterium]
MFIQTIPTSAQGLSQHDVVEITMNEALQKITQLTGLDRMQGLNLLENQIREYNHLSLSAPIVDDHEINFINQLFH